MPRDNPPANRQKPSKTRRPAGTGDRATPQSPGKVAPGKAAPGKTAAGKPAAPAQRAKRPAARAGRDARDVAVTAVHAIVHDAATTDAALQAAFATAPKLEPRDRALARTIAMASLRRHGALTHVLDTYLERGLPKRSGRLKTILTVAAAQLLVLELPAHAVLDIAVDQARDDRRAGPFAGLTNAVLRRMTETGRARLAELAPGDHDIPTWLRESWQAAYGADTARAICEATLREPALDLSVKADPDVWAKQLGGILLPTGTVRKRNEGRIEDLTGYNDGAWWVQDAASALPAQLLGDVRGLRVLDLCAAPGGKTAQLAAMGARVTALDISAKRLVRLHENLKRLRLDVEVVTADALEYRPEQAFDAVLLDAPCSATGTIRRHPDILFHRKPSEIGTLAKIQSDLLGTLPNLVKPGGLIVYASCSLQPEEGPDQIARALTEIPALQRVPLSAELDGLPAELISADGDLRVLPFHFPHEDSALSGADGFFAARLRYAP